MSLAFDVTAQSAAGGRRGTLHLPHGAVQTPVFMPVGTAATVKTVEQGVLERLGPGERGAEIILANTYHLYLRPGHELIRRLGGVHRFMSWDRPMLTDSGGFQVFSLAKLRKVTPDGVEFRSHLDGSKHFFSPEHSMAVQIALGADVMMAFDECVETPASWERTRDSMGLTHAWARRSLDYWRAHRHEVPWGQGPGDNAQGPGPRGQGPVKETVAVAGVAQVDSPVSASRRDPIAQPSPGPWALSPEPRFQALFGIVQGGMYPDLRRQSAEELVAMDFPGYAIGGLAVGEPREVTREMIAHTLQFLPPDKPRYVMGVGYPDEIEEYARLGVDMMDCVLPTRAGRHGLLFVREDPANRGSKVLRLNIKREDNRADPRPPDEGCTCPVCRRYSRAYLRHLFASGEPLGATLNSMHNLHFYLETMERVRADLGGAVAGAPLQDAASLRE